MIEAVENHMPEVIIIDEIGRELEAVAARTIAERGVQLIGTAHGNNLENLLMNPTLSDLVGGIESVTLSDEEARRRGTQKSVLERRAPPTFDVLIEIKDRQHMVIHHDVAAAVDAHPARPPADAGRALAGREGRGPDPEDEDDARRNQSEFDRERRTRKRAKVRTRPTCTPGPTSGGGASGLPDGRNGLSERDTAPIEAGNGSRDAGPAGDARRCASIPMGSGKTGCARRPAASTCRSRSWTT